MFGPFMIKFHMNISAHSFIPKTARGPNYFLLPLLLLLMFSCGKSPEKTVIVDLKEKVETQRDLTTVDGAPMRIAIGAMISPRETAAYYDQMMSYVSRKVGRPVELVQKKTYQEINDLLEKKEIELAFVCAGPYVAGKKKFGMELLVAPVLYGKPFY